MHRSIADYTRTSPHSIVGSFRRLLFFFATALHFVHIPFLSVAICTLPYRLLHSQNVETIPHFCTLPISVALGRFHMQPMTQLIINKHTNAQWASSSDVHAFLCIIAWSLHVRLASGVAFAVLASVRVAWSAYVTAA